MNFEPIFEGYVGYAETNLRSGNVNATQLQARDPALGARSLVQDSKVFFAPALKTSVGSDISQGNVDYAGRLNVINKRAEGVKILYQIGNRAPVSVTDEKWNLIRLFRSTDYTDFF